MISSNNITSIYIFISDVNECEMPDPVCKNGATCKNLMGSYYCNCAEGFEGPNCENGKADFSWAVMLWLS